jgi:salicylate hydroxylase
MRVGIVGAGIGGLALAAALRDTNVDVAVYEQAPELREVGAGLQVAPNASRVLHQLGLREEVQRIAVSPSATHFRRWDDASLIAAQALGDTIEREFGAPWYTVHRAELHELLLRSSGEGIVELRRRLVRVDQTSRGVVLHFADGNSARCDIAVGADGIRSTVRAALFGDEQPRFTGNTAWRGLLPARDVAGLDLPCVSTALLGPGRHFVYYFVSGGRSLNWVALTPSNTWTDESWTAPGDAADAMAEYAGWTSIPRRLIAAQPGTIFRWALYDRDPLPTWGRGRVTLLGDAAHPMLPFMSQGAAQALEDAAVLAISLERVRDPVDALRVYEDLRRERTARVQLGSRANERIFHLADGPEQEVRDQAFRERSTAGGRHSDAWVFGYDATVATAHL